MLESQCRAQRTQGRLDLQHNLGNHLLGHPDPLLSLSLFTGLLWAEQAALGSRGAEQAQGMLRLLPARLSVTSSWGDTTPRSFTAALVLLFGFQTSVKQPKRVP